MLFMNISEMLRYENDEIIHRKMKMASVRWRNLPSSMQRVSRYIDMISSLFMMNGKIASRIIVVNIRKRPEIVIEVRAIVLKSFFSFRNGRIRKR